MNPPQVWTIGHSTHAWPDFVGLLHAHGIDALVDVRRFPGSRRHPQFGQDALRAGLQDAGIAYAWVAPLGGRRKPDPADPEGNAWRHPSFRAYAQHVRTEEFAQGLHVLLDVATACRAAVMCSELLWWRCHRRLIADVMVVCGWQVVHILGQAESAIHRIAPPARWAEDGLSYETGDAPSEADCC